jgi:lysylphosphatidylglycerol synthetase-like protein (DUF2156 family)
MLLDCARSPLLIAMTSFSRHELLQPSLDRASRLSAAPYSLQTGIWSAFFGGPPAAIAMIGINAWRVGRWRRDLTWVALLVVAYVAWIFFMYATPAGAEWRATLAGWLGGRAMAYCERFLAFMVFLGGMLLHRSEQRSADLFGLKRPNGWLMGILLIVVGFVAGALLLLGVAA